MNEQDVLLTYQSISHLMEAMVVAARARDWQTLQALENRCRPLTGQLMSSESTVILSESGARQKFDYLRRILADDGAIRRETEPWMDELQMAINATGTRRKLNQAYLAG